MPTVTVHPSGEVIYLDPDETVLSGCRSGEFSYDHPIADSVLTDGERTDGTCLTCRAVPRGDITIEMRNEDLRLINPFLRQINEKARQRAESVLSGTVLSSTESKEQ